MDFVPHMFLILVAIDTQNLIHDETYIFFLEPTLILSNKSLLSLAKVVSQLRSK